jgi:hypothetical protein
MIRNELKRLTLEQLAAVRGQLYRSNDAYADGALKMVECEIRLKRRVVRESCH